MWKISGIRRLLLKGQCGTSAVFQLFQVRDVGVNRIFGHSNSRQPRLSCKPLCGDYNQNLLQMETTQIFCCQQRFERTHYQQASPFQQERNVYPHWDNVRRPHNGGGANEHQDSFENWQEGRFIINHSMGHESTSKKIFRFTKKENKKVEAMVKCDIQCRDNLVVFLSKLVSGAISTWEKEKIFHETVNGNGWSFTAGHLLVSKMALVDLDPSAVVGMKGRNTLLPKRYIYVKNLSMISTLLIVEVNKLNMP
eukprot:scaffold54222_cov65-Cyclotella_meneghiniana.AAC.3